MHRADDKGNLFVSQSYLGFAVAPYADMALRWMREGVSAGRIPALFELANEPRWYGGQAIAMDNRSVGVHTGEGCIPSAESAADGDIAVAGNILQRDGFAGDIISDWRRAQQGGHSLDALFSVMSRARVNRDVRGPAYSVSFALVESGKMPVGVRVGYDDSRLDGSGTDDRLELVRRLVLSGGLQTFEQLAKQPQTHIFDEIWKGEALIDSGRFTEAAEVLKFVAGDEHHPCRGAALMNMLRAGMGSAYRARQRGEDDRVFTNQIRDTYALMKSAVPDWAEFADRWFATATGAGKSRQILAKQLAALDAPPRSLADVPGRPAGFLQPSEYRRLDAALHLSTTIHSELEVRRITTTGQYLRSDRSSVPVAAAFGPAASEYLQQMPSHGHWNGHDELELHVLDLYRSRLHAEARRQELLRLEESMSASDIDTLRQHDPARLAGLRSELRVGEIGERESMSEPIYDIDLL